MWQELNDIRLDIEWFMECAKLHNTILMLNGTKLNNGTTRVLNFQVALFPSTSTYDSCPRKSTYE